MAKAIILLGIPGSGKTTWAKKYQTKHPGTKRVNRDELRRMLDDGKWSNSRESFVIDVEDYIVHIALKGGHDIIIDDTNLNPSTMARWSNLLLDDEFEIETKDFTNISLETCIERDAKRENKVGEKVVRKFYNLYVKKN